MNELWSALAAVEGSRWMVPALSCLRILLVAVAAWVLTRVLLRLVEMARVHLHASMGDGDALRRAETLTRVSRYLITLLVGGLAVMLVLAEVGVSLAPILGAAGVVGVAVGFGAQSLVKDYFTGFFILLEDQIRTGDVVEIAGIGGRVEDITLRHVRLRDYDGNVHFVPNSLITTVTNMGRGYAQSVIDVSVGFREDVDEVVRMMREVAADLRGDVAFADRILADLEMAGVEAWEQSAIKVRCRFMVAPLAQWDVRREFLKRLAKVFAEHGIEMPYQPLRLYPAADGHDERSETPTARPRADAKRRRAAG